MDIILNIMIMILVPLLFFLLIFLCVKEAFAQTNFPNLTLKEVLISEIILCAMLLMVYSVIKQNNYIYYWDYGREWRSAIIVKNNILDNPLSALKNIYWSINNEDYNQFMPMLIIFPIWLIDSSFKGYVLLVEMFYMIPAIIVISLLTYKVFMILNLKWPGYPIILSIVAVTPILHYVMFDGFMDPPVLTLVSCILMLSVNFEYAEIQPRKCVLLAISLTLLMLFRRHFAYFVVGYLFSQFVFFLIQLYEKNRGGGGGSMLLEAIYVICS